MSDNWVLPDWAIKEGLSCKVTHFRRDLYGLWQDLFFLTSGIPIRGSRRPYDIEGRIYSRVGCPIRGFRDFRYLDPIRPQTPYHLFGAQGSNFGPAILGYDCYRQHYGSVLDKKTGSDAFLFPVTSSSKTISVAEHSTQGQTHSWFLNIILDHLSRPNQPLSTVVESQSRDCNSNLRDVG